MAKDILTIISYGIHHGLFRDTFKSSIEHFNYLECKDKSSIFSSLEGKDDSRLVILCNFNNNLKAEFDFIKLAGNVIKNAVIILLSENIKELHSELENDSFDKNLLLIKSSKDQIELMCQVQFLVQTLNNLLCTDSAKTDESEEHILKKVSFNDKKTRKINRKTIKALAPLQAPRVILLTKNEKQIEEQLGKLENENVSCTLMSSSELALSEMRKGVRQKQPYLAILTDESFDGMGLEVLTQVMKADKSLRSVRTILLGNDGSLDKGREGKVDHLLEESFSVNDLMEILNNEEVLANTKTKQDKKIKHKKVSNAGSQDAVNVLVVDDNAIVRRYMIAMLEKEKFPEIDVAENGEEAIQMARNKSYQFIFMDVFMPQMDGFEVAAEIRKFNTESVIVALSADSKDETKEKCLKSGMNEFLAKPISKQDLLTAMNNVTTSSEKLVGESHVVIDASCGGANEDCFVFNKISALETFGGDEKLLQEVVTKFLKTTPVKLEEIETAFKNKELEDLERVVAGLKGGTEYIGAERLKHAAHKIKLASENGEVDKLRGFINFLHEEYRDFEGLVKELYRT